MDKPGKWKSAVKDPLLPLHIVLLWSFWMAFMVLPDQADSGTGELLLQGLLTLILYAIPLALVIVALVPRR